MPERLSIGSTIQSPRPFSPDAKRLVFDSPSSAPYDLGVLSLDATPSEAMVLTTSFNETNGNVARDGAWLAYQSNESGQNEIYLSPFPDVNASKRQVSTQGGTRPLWSKDGRELFYYVEPDTIMAVPVTSRSSLALGKPLVVVKGTYARASNTGTHYDVSPDGKRFLLLKDIETADGVKPAAPEIHLVQHWSEELKRLLP